MCIKQKTFVFTEILYSGKQFIENIRNIQAKKYKIIKH